LAAGMVGWWRYVRSRHGGCSVSRLKTQERRQ
jgi:hypothetical protein